jgi:hypothetical protein
MPPKKSESTSTKEKQTITLLVVEKNGDIKETEMKKDMITPDELAKKCKFKKYDGFCKRTEWGYNIQNFKLFVEMWAKNDGIANQENKYEFPPPLDHDLYFGACVLIAHDVKNNYVDLTESLWDKIYEHLFGGFESLVSTRDDDDDEEDELDNIPDSKKTKHGYLKDGFVVDGGVNTDDDDDDVEDDEDEEDEDEEEIDEDDDDDDEDIEDDESDNSNESDINNSSDDDIENDSDGNESGVNKVKKNNKKNNASNSKHSSNKHSNTILKTNTKIKNENRVSMNSNNKDKKIDVSIRTDSILSNNRKVSSLLSNSKSKNSNSSGHTKNIKVSKVEEEVCDGYKSNDSSELSEEEYTYT